jgi:uncharacterized protein
MRYLFTIFLFLIFDLSAQIPTKPEPAQYVNDYSGLLNDAQKINLETELEAFYQSSSNQLVIVIIDTIPKDNSIEIFAEKWFANWGIGEKEKDNGVLLLISLKDRKTRIEVGYGLESAIPDAFAAQIIDRNMIPNFRDGNYYDGIVSAVNRIKEASRGEFKKIPNPDKEQHWRYIFYLFVFGPILITLLGSRVARKAFAVFLFILIFIAFFIDIILWDEEFGLGFWILENMKIWFILITVFSILLQSYRLKNEALSIIGFYYWGRIPFFQVALLLVAIFADSFSYHKLYQSEILFIGFHLLVYFQRQIFLRQYFSLYAVENIKKNTDFTNNHSWSNIFALYTESSIRKRVSALKRKMSLSSLIKGIYTLLSETHDFTAKPEQYFTPRADFKLCSLFLNYFSVQSEYAEAHRKFLDNFMNEEGAYFRNFAEMPELPQSELEKFEKSIQFWAKIVNKNAPNSFLQTYISAKDYHNPSNWTNISKRYQNSEKFLSEYEKLYAEFLAEDTLFMQSKELSIMLSKHKEILNKLQDESPKRNDLIIDPLIEQIFNKGALNSPVYLKEDRDRYKELADKEKFYFNKNANIILSLEDQQRLEKSIETFRTLFESPEKLMQYDLEFLTVQYNNANAWDWKKYSLYTTESVSNAKIQTQALIKAVNESNFAPEKLCNLYYFIKKIPTLLVKVPISTYTHTYSSSSSSSSSYTKSGSGSSYKKSYSTSYKTSSSSGGRFSGSSSGGRSSGSSFGGGKSGGGGASGSW